MKEERASQTMILCMASLAPYLYLSLSWCYESVQIGVINGMYLFFFILPRLVRDSLIENGGGGHGGLNTGDFRD